MTWLLVVLAWTVCATLMAPLVGRVLAQGSVISRASRRPVDRPLPTPRQPLVLH
jgi:hypothetical protein